ncbi:hypothetical protein RB195_011436 [Necator americanus]|uniref:Uncharacterized protein n=1 Tax=Necator americanus TaxID=51031 RepID=A0ABR1D3B8_NECAM
MSTISTKVKYNSITAAFTPWTVQLVKKRCVGSKACKGQTVKYSLVHSSLFRANLCKRRSPGTSFFTDAIGFMFLEKLRREFSNRHRMLTCFPSRNGVDRMVLNCQKGIGRRLMYHGCSSRRD